MRDIERRIEADFRDEPDIRADLYQQTGDSYRTQADLYQNINDSNRSQELYADAERSLRKALNLRLELYGEDSAKVAESMFILSGVRHQQGNFAEQEQLLAKAVGIQRRHAEEGNNLPYMLVDEASLTSDRRNDYARFGIKQRSVGDISATLRRESLYGWNDAGCDC